ncbi:MAG: glutamate racemase [Polyangiales bacterium]
MSFCPDRAPSAPSSADAPDAQAIGIFDSGLGGLTVVRAIAARFPGERLLYLGDTARVPYGSRTAATVVRYAERCAAFLQARQVKVVVVACNTVSAVALESLRSHLQVPVLGVIEPGARAALQARRRAGAVGVLATEGTAASGAYPAACRRLDPAAPVVVRAAPLLVPLVEEGWLRGRVPALAVARYLADFEAQRIDTLLLGCTHYPLLRPVIEAHLQAHMPAVRVIDSASAVAAALHTLLPHAGQPEVVGGPRLQICVTDRPAGFARQAEAFLGTAVQSEAVQLVDL